MTDDRQQLESEALARVFAGDGEARALARAVDWARTPLGPVAGWSEAHRSAVRLVLANDFQMMLWWGPSFVQVYNDAYTPVLGDKHPRAMGQRFADCWKEVFHIVGPMAERPFLGGPPSTSDDIPLPLDRKVRKEEAHFRLSYSAVPDDTVPGTGIGGVLAVLTETTEQSYGERQLRALRALGAHITAEDRTVAAACATAAAVLAGDPWDVPFALVYVVDDGGRHARLVASAGFGPDGPPAAIPADVELAGDQPGALWPLARVARQRAVEVVGLGAVGAALPASPWAEPPREAIVLPLASPDQASVHGLLVCGLSPHRVLDTGYRTFFELVAAQVITAVRNARALEAEQRRVEALAAIDRAKTAFFSNVSHEFRTPLTLMLGPTDDLLRGVHGELAGEQRAQLEMIRRNELRLFRLVNALLEFSRIEAGRIQARYQPTDLAAFTRDLASGFRAAVERAGLRFTVDCAPVGDDVFVDRAMWEQIVLNLLSNAFKFTFEGEIAVRLRRDGDTVTLEVRDTGVGVRAEDVPRLFERFHRVEGTRARTHEGSGIGLALVQELTRLHGGTVAVDSTLGAGTTFRVRIPAGTAHLAAERIAGGRADDPAAGATTAFVEEALRWLPDDPAVDAGRPPDEPTDPAAPRARLLVADDNADMRDYLRRVLGTRWDVETVNDGAAALAAAGARRPDLIVTDAMMPGLDGVRLLRALRERPSTRDLPIIMVSARAGEEALVEGLQAGADDYLVKPFSARELVARVRTHLELAGLRRELRHQHERVATLLMRSPVPIAVVRGEALVFELANDALAELLGRRDLVGAPLLDAVPELRGDGLGEHLREVVRTGDVFAADELPLRFARGPHGAAEVYWTVTCAPFAGPDGARDRVIITALDVTARALSRRRSEEDGRVARAAADDAESAVRDRDEFLAVASHELRTPLTTLGLQLDGLLRGLRGEGGDGSLATTLRRAERVREQAERLEALVAAMTDTLELGRGAPALAREEVDLAAVAREVVERTRPDARRARSVVELSAAPATGWWDRARLAQILGHLIDNALKFGAGKEVRVVVEADGATARVTVADRGIGVAAEHHERIFDRFGRATSASDYGGFGLGLWIVRKLARAMDGTVRVDSEPGRGAAFTVELPRRP
ncbi:MAG TPA: ATP-binding protein [Kofleriaceae bacterium]|nr:ATP-binding protein [Kofleriaceae bacterium]